MSNSNFGFLALALRQRLIKRWSLMHSVQPESVLEHSAVVTLLSYLAGNIAIQQGKSVDLAVMLAHASLHDAAEVLCSDVVTPVKKANAVMTRATLATDENFSGALSSKPGTFSLATSKRHNKAGGNPCFTSQVFLLMVKPSVSRFCPP